jgi:hypothetical protein
MALEGLTGAPAIVPAMKWRAIPGHPEPAGDRGHPTELRVTRRSEA